MRPCPPAPKVARSTDGKRIILVPVAKDESFCSSGCTNAARSVVSVKIIIFSCLLARVDLSQMERLAVQLNYGGADRVMELSQILPRAVSL